MKSNVVRWRFQMLQRVILFPLICLLALPVCLRGEPGSLDTGFGEGGLLAALLGGSANSVVCQSDGKIVVGGSFGVARLLQDGRLDASFGDGGVATFGRSTNQTLSVGTVLPLPDGKIIVSVGGALARLLASGDLDTSFGQSGFSLGTEVADRSDSITALRLQPDGKIVASGSSSLRSGSEVSFLVLRFGADGFNDPDFGNRGRALATFDSPLAVGRAVVVQGDGGIVIGGGVRFNGHLAFGLARFTATGFLDASFGNGGKVIVPLADSFLSQVNGVALQSDGRIIAAGVANGTNAADFAVVRLNTDGSLDLSFGDQGIQRTDLSNGSLDIAVAAAVMADDKILVAGSTGINIFKRAFALIRYNSDGSLDGSFGQGGLVSTQFPLSEKDEAYALAMVGDGRIILAGLTSGSDGDRCALVRYHVNDLSVLASASADHVAVGDSLYYSVIVKNHRLAGVTGMRLIDQLPSSVHFQSAFSTQGTCTNIGDQVICELGSLASGGQAAVTIFASMHATAHLCSSAMVSANETDPALTNSAIACATIDLLREVPQNLAVTAIRAPKRVVLDATHPETTKLVAVEIQNRSPNAEQITDLNGVVDLKVRSLAGTCPDLVPVLLTESPQAQLPVLLSPKAKLKVYFRVTYARDCVPDALKTIRFEPHNDYEYVALSHHDAVDDNRDTFAEDDICPRSALGNVTTAGGSIKDLGCGSKIFGGGFGKPVVTDVIVK